MFFRKSVYCLYCDTCAFLEFRWPPSLTRIFSTRYPFIKLPLLRDHQQNLLKKMSETPPPVPSNDIVASPKESPRNRVIQELIATERTYVQRLQVTIDVFIHPQ